MTRRFAIRVKLTNVYSGHVDPGESDMQTALRETEEEAGLTSEHVRLTDFRRELHYQVRQKPKIVVYWLAELVCPTVAVRLSEEHKDFRWLQLEDACRLAEYSDMQGLLHECDKYLTSEQLS